MIKGIYKDKRLWADWVIPTTFNCTDDNGVFWEGIYNTRLKEYNSRPSYEVSPQLQAKWVDGQRYEEWRDFKVEIDKVYWCYKCKGYGDSFCSEMHNVSLIKDPSGKKKICIPIESDLDGDILTKPLTIEDKPALPANDEIIEAAKRLISDLDGVFIGALAASSLRQLKEGIERYKARTEPQKEQTESNIDALAIKKYPGKEKKAGEHGVIVRECRNAFKEGLKAGYQSKQELEVEILFEHKAMTKLLADITGLPIYSSVKKFKEQFEKQSKQVAGEWVFDELIKIDDACENMALGHPAAYVIPQIRQIISDACTRLKTESQQPKQD